MCCIKYIHYESCLHWFIFMFLTVTTRKLKMTYVACIPSLVALIHSIHLVFFFLICV